MSIRVACPSCGKALRADENLEGKRVRCGACDNVFVAAPDTPLDAWSEPPLTTTEPESRDPGGKAIASLVLGILGLIGWCLPIVGLPMTIVGLVLGIKGQKSASHQGMAIAGVVLNIVGLVLSAANAAIGAYLGATGQHPLLR